MLSLCSPRNPVAQGRRVLVQPRGEHLQLPDPHAGCFDLPLHVFTHLFSWGGSSTLRFLLPGKQRTARAGRIM